VAYSELVLRLRQVQRQVLPMNQPSDYRTNRTGLPPRQLVQKQLVLVLVLVLLRAGCFH
jgi:hypothetical protein